LLKIFAILSITYFELQKNISNYGTTSEVIADYKSHVSINNIQYEIHVFDSQVDGSVQTNHEIQFQNKKDSESTSTTNMHPNRSNYKNTINELYICTDCEIAERTRDELLKVL